MKNGKMNATRKAATKATKTASKSGGQQGAEYLEWASQLIRGTAAEIVDEVKRALKQERKPSGQSRKYPDRAVSPFSQYMKWVAHLKDAPDELLRQTTLVQAHADRARFEEGKAHNLWNARAEGGSSLPVTRPHDWRARNEWRLAILGMMAIEEAAARRWPAEEILEAKKKAAARIKQLS